MRPMTSAVFAAPDLPMRAPDLPMRAPLQDAVLAAGCLGALVRLTASAEGELRLNATWALQNLVYQADGDVRAALLDALSWQQALALASDIRPDVQVRHADFFLFSISQSPWACVATKRPCSHAALSLAQ